MELNVDLRDLVSEGQMDCDTCHGIGIIGCKECGGTGKVLNQIGRELLLFVARWTRVHEGRLLIRKFRDGTE